MELLAARPQAIVWYKDIISIGILVSYQRHIITCDPLYNACSQEVYTFDIAAAVFRFSLESSLEVSDGAPRAPWRAAQPKKPTSIRRHTRRNESS